ncbi:hypothetical protein BDR22DRAFT_964211 [Usnea florida]
MPEPKFVNKIGSDLEALLAAPFMQDPYPYTGPKMILPSYSFEASDSVYCVNLKKKVKHALRHAWKYDPIRCSVKAAFDVGRELDIRSHNGLTEKEYAWITGRKLRTAKKRRRAALVDFEQARRQKGWRTKHRGSDDGLSIDQELDEFYGSNGTKLRPIDDNDNNFSDEGFSERDTFTKTIITLPEKSLMEEGVTPGGIFQDSGVVMDESYADYSRAHSAPNTAKEPAGVQWPSFDVAMAPLRFPKKTVRSLGLFGDQKEREWHGRQQGPYDFHGAGSWASARETDQVTFVEGAEAISEDLQDIAESFTPQPVPRETSIGRDAMPTSSPTLIPVTGVQDANQHIDGTSDVDIPGDPLSTEVLPPTESVRHDQEVSVPVQGRVGDETSEATTQPSLHYGSDQDRMNILPSECLIGPPVSIEEVRNTGSSTGEVQLLGVEQPQHFHRSAGNGRDPAPTSHVTRELPQMDIDTNRHVPHGSTTTAFSTPMTQRTGQIQQVQIETPATPATISISLTPRYNSDMDADDASVGSLEVRIPDSPTNVAETGQSALGHYVQDPQSQSNPAAHGSSTVSLAGSGSDEISLIPAQACPDPPEGHAGFSKGVELHQKEADAVFSLDLSKASEVSPSSSDTAPIPVTPANGNDSVPFEPTTPFQLDTSTRPDFGNLGTPTPAPKTSKVNKNSVMNVFRSPKLGSRSPERAEESPGIVVAPYTPTTGAASSQSDSPFGNRGLLFQPVKKNERSTKNVLNSLNLSAEPASGITSEHDSQDDSEDELAGGGNAGVSRVVFKGAKHVADTPPAMNEPIDPKAGARRTLAPAVVVRNLRSRGGNQGDVSQGLSVETPPVEEPRKKRQRRSRKSVRGLAKGSDGLGPSSEFEQ